MYTGIVQKCGISVTFTEIFQYLKCSFSSCVLLVNLKINTALKINFDDAHDDHIKKQLLLLLALPHDYMQLYLCNQVLWFKCQTIIGVCIDSYILPKLHVYSQ